MDNDTLTGRLARYMAEAARRPLPPEVAQQARFRLLDTLAAMISGSQLPAGEMATRFTRAQGGTEEATVVGTGLRTTAINAALANAMFAHADETDDFDPPTKAHPGSHVVPAALAMAERLGRSGAELLSAIALGYDLGCRFLLALQPQLVRGSHRSAEGTASTMGAVGAAAALAGLDERRMRYALSYAAQQVCGIWSWVRDVDHVEKAFDFSGMGARNGVTAALMAEMGFTGVADVFDGEHNALIALSSDPRPEQLVAGLGSRYLVAESSIKPFSVGFPIQAPLWALLTLMREHGLQAHQVERVVARLPQDGAQVVNNRSMPDVNCQHILALALVDGGISFESSHSHERMHDPRVLQVRERVELVADPALVDPAAPRSGKVTVHLRGVPAPLERFVPHAPGAKENPMSAQQVRDKARNLIEPVLGAARTRELIERVEAADEEADVRAWSPLLQA